MAGVDWANRKLSPVRQWLEAPASDVPSPRRPKMNLLRGAVARITTPLLPDDYLHLANPLWSARELRGRIIEVRRETEDTATLVIKPGWGFDFDYKPGQYVGIGLHIDGRWHWRSYSLTSPPSHGTKRISITVKAMPEGFLSSHIVGGVPEGTIVRLAKPQGDFSLPDPPPAKTLFITAGSGITPVIAMLRTLDGRGPLPDIAHVHSAPTRADVLFGDELDDLAKRHERFVPHLRFTRAEGRFDLADLDTCFPDWRERQTWACGPASMLTEIENVWRSSGIAEHLHLERFELERADTSGTGGTVTFKRSGRTTEVDGATTLMLAGEALGVQMPFGCRMGICQTCVVPLLEGHTTDLRSGEQRHAGDRIQTCISVAAGDCTIDV